MALIEHEYGIRSTYYFRTVKEVFQPDIIRKIADHGHEIEYHYEVLDKAKTICMHGNPLTSRVR
jgi:hypothetical protein